MSTPETAMQPDLQPAQLVRTVATLYADRATPFAPLVRWRLRRDFPWRLPGGPQMAEILAVAKATPELKVREEGTRALHFAVLLAQEPAGFEGFMEELANHEEEIIPQDLLIESAMLLLRGGWTQAEDPQDDKYEIATWLQDCSDTLGSVAWGQVLRIVRWFTAGSVQVLGKRDKRILPYPKSEDYEKQENARLCRPTGLRDGERYISSWRDLEYFVDKLLRDAGGAVRLSDLKKCLREKYHWELSETALGHTSLLELMKDERCSAAVHVEKAAQGETIWLRQRPSASSEAAAEELQELREAEARVAPESPPGLDSPRTPPRAAAPPALPAAPAAPAAPPGSFAVGVRPPVKMPPPPPPPSPETPPPQTPPRQPQLAPTAPTAPTTPPKPKRGDATVLDAKVAAEFADALRDASALIEASPAWQSREQEPRQQQAAAAAPAEPPEAAAAAAAPEKSPEQQRKEAFVEHLLERQRSPEQRKEMQLSFVEAVRRRLGTSLSMPAVPAAAPPPPRRSLPLQRIEEAEEERLSPGAGEGEELRWSTPPPRSQRSQCLADVPSPPGSWPPTPQPAAEAAAWSAGAAGAGQGWWPPAAYMAGHGATSKAAAAPPAPAMPVDLHGDAPRRLAAKSEWHYFERPGQTTCGETATQPQPSGTAQTVEAPTAEQPSEEGELYAAVLRRRKDRAFEVTWSMPLKQITQLRDSLLTPQAAPPTEGRRAGDAAGGAADGARPIAFQ